MGFANKTVLSLVLLLSVISTHARVPVLQHIKLTCEYITNPLAIGTRKPRFAWMIQSQERNQFQSAYELIVSDDLKQIQTGKCNFWTTGKILSNQNIQIVYAGSPLQSNTRYYWRIKVYNQDNNSSD